MWDVQLFKLNYDHREAEAAKRVIESGWITMGSETSSFESSFSEFLGGEAHCTAVSSGTAALHMALLALDIGMDDEVIIPALTFVADVNVVKLVGAKPILADCGCLKNWNVTVESIERCITPKTKAVMVVHYAGYPCDMVGISKLCREREIALIEDVAHAPGASVNGISCGLWGDIGCFSFFTNKNLSVGEGGMVSTKNLKLHGRLKYLRSHGMTSLTLDRHKGRAITYDVTEPGLNYRIDEMRSAIGLVQLDKLSAANSRRKVLTERYRQHLSESSIGLPFENTPSGYLSAYHIFPVLLPVNSDRQEVIRDLKSKRIQSSIHYPPFWELTAFSGQYSALETPVAADICDRELTLPLFPTMSEDEVDFVSSELLNAIS
jgi:dTDP-4-amino-4,6-dideoxygalactose transaminase